MKGKPFEGNYNNNFPLGKRLRTLTKREQGILNSYFEKDPNWKRKTVKAASKQLNLEYKKVYKWGYDLKMRFLKKDSENKGLTVVKANSCSISPYKEKELIESLRLDRQENFNDVVNEIMHLCDNTNNISVPSWMPVTENKKNRKLPEKLDKSEFDKNIKKAEPLSEFSLFSDDDESFKNCLSIFEDFKQAINSDGSDQIFSGYNDLMGIEDFQNENIE